MTIRFVNQENGNYVLELDVDEKTFEGRGPTLSEALYDLMLEVEYENL